MNDPVLKLKMAKLLPEKIEHVWRCGFCGYKQDTRFTKCSKCNDRLLTIHEYFFWKRSPALSSPPRPVLETEWLYVMQLVEEQHIRSIESDCKYVKLLNEICRLETTSYTPDRATVSATFNQRATAMCNFKNAAVGEPPTTAAPTNEEKESR